MKTVSLLYVLSIAVLAVNAQEPSFSYEELPVLGWEDFRGEPDLSSTFHANTNSGFSYSWSYSTSNGGMDLKYEVLSTFYPNLSWVHPEHKVDALLKHEQLHFDISELHARKLRKAMSTYKPGQSIRKDLKNLYTRIEKERVTMQNNFDRETNHSMNKVEEAKWQTFVKAELEKLEAFTKD